MYPGNPAGFEISPAASPDPYITDNSMFDALSQQTGMLRAQASQMAGPGASPVQRAAGQTGVVNGQPVIGTTTLPTPDENNPYVQVARQAAAAAGLDPTGTTIFLRMIQAESGFNPQTGVSSKGARGIAQIMPQYHPGVNPDDPQASLFYAAKLVAGYLQQYGGNWEKVLTAYSAGPAWANSPVRPPETVAYIQQILGQQQAPVIQGNAPVQTQDPNKVLAFAKGQQGKRYAGPIVGEPDSYRWGSPGWDCSSFVSAAFREVGIKLTPFTDAIANETKQIAPDQAQPGDIVLFKYADNSQPGVKYPHVGIYLGNGQIIDASYGRGVTIRAMPNLPYEFRRPG